MVILSKKLRKRKSSYQLPQAAPQRERLMGKGSGTDCKAIRTSPHCLSESEFAGACAELLLEGQKVGVAAKRSGVERERLVCFSFAHQKKMLKKHDKLSC